jgi:GxxExxY protein
MPVTVHAETHRVSQEDFGRVAYNVMGHVFAIHAEFGRFLREEIYHSEIARRCGALVKIPVEVRHGDFLKFYFIDLLVDGGGVFELKTVQRLTDRHRSQLLQYLLLADLSHGKVVNLSPDLVEHEFVNTTLTHVDRVRFTIDAANWDTRDRGAVDLQDAIVGLLRDLGTGLSNSLYEGVLTHLLGGKSVVNSKIDVFNDGRIIGSQPVRLSAPSMAFKVTTVREADERHLEAHLRRFLTHTKLNGIQWINVRHRLVTFRTIRHET